MTHGIDEKIQVTRDGKQFGVDNYAHAGPLELWTILRTIEGIAATAEWENVRRESKCPE